MPELEERWRAEIPGQAHHAFLVDHETASVFVGDGWSVAYAALRLHRFDLHTGAHLADLRTRHQGVGALAMALGNLFAATDSRMFELDTTTLEIERQWDRGLVRYTMQLVPDGSKLIAANWLMPSIGIFEPDPGKTRRMQAGRQPLIFRHGDDVKVITGFDGGLATIDTKRSRLVDRMATPPIARATAGADIWAIAAGPPQGGQGKPPVWTRRGSNALLRLTGAPVHIRLPAELNAAYADDSRQLVWCIAANDSWAVAQDSGRIVAHHTAPRGFQIQYVHPTASVALATKANPPNAICACLALP